MGSIRDAKALERLASAIEQAAKQRGLSFETTASGDPQVHLGNEIHVVVRDSDSLLVPSVTVVRTRLGGETLAVEQFVVTILGDVNTWSSAVSASSGLTLTDADFAQVLLDQNA